MQKAEARTQKLDLRLTLSAKRKLQSAAATAQRSLSEFVLESALVRADETLPDRQHFGLNGDQWRAFLAALEAPPLAAPRPSKLLNQPSVFEKGKA